MAEVATERSPFSTEEQILALYAQIEETATGVIKSGNAIGNPLLAEGYKDPRYAISVTGPVEPESQVGRYLADVTGQIARTDPGFVPNHPAHLHLTFSEIVHSEKGRKNLNLKSSGVKNYYKALAENFPPMTNIRCRFLKIMPTADPPPDPEHPEKRPISVVAAFLPEGDEIFQLRRNLGKAMSEAGLSTTDLGIPRVFFVTLGRFKDAPIQTESGIPLLEAIDRINNSYQERLTFEIDKMEVITTATKYVFSSGHVFLSPPIPFDKDKRSKEDPRYVRPSLRRASTT